MFTHLLSILHNYRHQIFVYYANISPPPLSLKSSWLICLQWFDETLDYLKATAKNVSFISATHPGVNASFQKYSTKPSNSCNPNKFDTHWLWFLRHCQEEIRNLHVSVLFNFFLSINPILNPISYFETFKQYVCICTNENFIKLLVIHKFWVCSEVVFFKCRFVIRKYEIYFWSCN